MSDTLISEETKEKIRVVFNMFTNTVCGDNSLINISSKPSHRTSCILFKPSDNKQKAFPNSSKKD